MHRVKDHHELPSEFRPSPAFVGMRPSDFLGAPCCPRTSTTLHLFLYCIGRNEELELVSLNFSVKGPHHSKRGAALIQCSDGSENQKMFLAPTRPSVTSVIFSDS